MTVLLCMKQYVRGGVVPRAVTLSCHYEKDHAAGCSWESIKRADDRETEARIAASRVSHPSAASVDAAVVEDVVDGIRNGEFDPWLEMLLTAAHSRKLALRGVRGFPRAGG